MSQWGDLDEAVGDELDPLTPNLSSFGDELDGDAEGDLLAARPEEFSPTLGFPDPDGIVRLWVDDEGVINKVRMSPSWRERLEGRPLESAYRTAFLWINNYLAPPAQAGVEDDGRVSERTFSTEALREKVLLQQQLEARLEALAPDEGHGQLRGAAVSGHSPDRNVSIELNERGLLADIRFKSEWLEEARVRQISEAVVRAAQDAAARFVPPVYEPGERDLINDEMVSARNDLLAMMRRGYLD